MDSLPVQVKSTVRSVECEDGVLAFDDTIQEKAYQDQLADAIMNGIKQYFARNAPLSKNRMT